MKQLLLLITVILICGFTSQSLAQKKGISKATVNKSKKLSGSKKPTEIIVTVVDEKDIAGKIENGVYKNDFFGFSLQPPPYQNTISQENIDANRKNNEEEAKNRLPLKTSKDAANNNIRLFTFAKEMIDSGKPNSLFYCNAIKISDAPSTPLGYARQLEGIMPKMSSKYTVGKSAYLTKFNNISFAGVEFDGNSNGIKFFHKNFVFYSRGYIILFYLS